MKRIRKKPEESFYYNTNARARVDQVIRWLESYTKYKQYTVKRSVSSSIWQIDSGRKRRLVEIFFDGDRAWLFTLMKGRFSKEGYRTGASVRYATYEIAKQGSRFETRFLTGYYRPKAVSKRSVYWWLNRNLF